MSKDFRKLKVCKRSHQLVLDLNRITILFPRTESYRLTAQIRRAGVSIPSNIVEGCGRSSDTELAMFCDVARGSASELEYQLLLAHDLKLIQPDDYEQLVQQTTEIKRILTVFFRRLRARGRFIRLLKP